MDIKYEYTEQYWHSETSIYWFDVDGEKYGLSDCNGDLNLLDYNGEPLRLDGHNLKIFEQLSEIYLTEI